MYTDFVQRFSKQSVYEIRVNPWLEYSSVKNFDGWCGILLSRRPQTSNLLEGMFFAENGRDEKFSTHRCAARTSTDQRILTIDCKHHLPAVLSGWNAHGADTGLHVGRNQSVEDWHQ